MTSFAIVCSHLLFKWFTPHLFTTFCLMENRGRKEVSCFSLQGPTTTISVLERSPANWPSLDKWFKDEETLYLISDREKSMLNGCFSHLFNEGQLKNPARKIHYYANCCLKEEKFLKLPLLTTLVIFFPHVLLVLNMK